MKVLVCVLFCSVSSWALATVVKSPVENLSIPKTIDGAFINVVTGVVEYADEESQPVRWDLNPYFDGNGFNVYWPQDRANASGGVASSATGPLLRLYPGDSVTAASFFNNSLGDSGKTFRVIDSPQYIGFRFFNEAANHVDYGYCALSIEGMDGFPAFIEQCYYEDTGAGIGVDISDFIFDDGFEGPP